MSKAQLLEASFNNKDCTFLLSTLMLPLNAFVPNSPFLIYQGVNENAEISVRFNQRTHETTITIRELRPKRRRQKRTGETQPDLGDVGEGDYFTNEGGVQTDDWLGQLQRHLSGLANRTETDSE